MAAVLAIAIPANSQDSSDYYTKYGFSLPLLKQGEYAISGNADYNKYTNYNNMTDTIPSWVETHSKSVDFNIGATLAITDQVVFRTELSYAPRLRSYDNMALRYDYFDRSPVYTSQIEKQTSYIQPLLTLAYHPFTNMEISVYASFWTAKGNYENTPPDSPYSSRDFKRTYNNFQFRFVYLGQL
jgi:hypothetical protein